MAEATVVHRAPSPATSSLLICPAAFPGLAQWHIPSAPLGRPAGPFLGATTPFLALPTERPGVSLLLLGMLQHLSSLCVPASLEGPRAWLLPLSS